MCFNELQSLLFECLYDIQIVPSLDKRSFFGLFLLISGSFDKLIFNRFFAFCNNSMFQIHLKHFMAEIWIQPFFQGALVPFSENSIQIAQFNTRSSHSIKLFLLPRLFRRKNWKCFFLKRKQISHLYRYYQFNCKITRNLFDTLEVQCTNLCMGGDPSAWLAIGAIGALTPSPDWGRPTGGRDYGRLAGSRRLAMGVH